MKHFVFKSDHEDVSEFVETDDDAFKATGLVAIKRSQWYGDCAQAAATQCQLGSSSTSPSKTSAPVPARL